MRPKPKISGGIAIERKLEEIAFTINMETITIPIEPITSSKYSLLFSTKLYPL